MRIEIIKCEICEAQTDTSHALPDSWITLKLGHKEEELHFHAMFCLARWLGGFMPTPQPQEQPACKARRFLLVDGETAELVNGIKWANGSVTLEGDTPFQSEHFTDWDRLKEHYDGSGVQWIDQEVSE